MTLPFILTFKFEIHTQPGYITRLLRDHQYLARAELDRFRALKHLDIFFSKEGIRRCSGVADNAGTRVSMLAIEGHEVAIMHH